VYEILCLIGLNCVVLIFDEFDVFNRIPLVHSCVFEYQMKDGASQEELCKGVLEYWELLKVLDECVRGQVECDERSAYHDCFQDYF
jgi:hypothetical protein